MIDEIKAYGFEYKDGELHWYDVNIKKVADEFGTPLFVLSADELTKRVRRIKDFADYEHLLCFSLKANNNPHLISELKKEGCGVDVVSGGELYLARKIGIHPKKIVFSGVGKTNHEIHTAQKEQILLLNIESESEYKIVRELAKHQSVAFGISFRVKFELSLENLHPYLGVGKKDSKFGMSEDLAFELYKDAHKQGLPVEGIHFHIGSQIMEMDIFEKASRLCLLFLERLEMHGIKIKYVDVGGGLGLDYNKLEEPNLKRYVDCFREMSSRNHIIIFELGRYLSAPSGILVSKVIRKKERECSSSFLVVDAGMTEVLRIPLYNAFHRLIPVRLSDGKEMKRFDIVGPICENSDYIAQDVLFPDLEEGEYICVLYAGAYTSTMMSNYNGRPFPPEVVIKNGRCTLSRRRQSYEELFSGYTDL